jgi:hypothetical protein
MRHDDDDFDENGILKDGRTFRVPVKMMDSMQRDIAHHFEQRQRPKDSAAFPRPSNGGPLVTDQWCGTAGLHRPGYRIESGGNVGDQLVRDGTADEIQRARDRYDYDVSNAWKRRDEWPNNADDDAETEARAGAVRNALLSRGHDPEDADGYLGDLDDGDLHDRDIGDHMAAFEQNLNGRDARTVAMDRKIRLDELYRQRDAELANEWRKGK